MNNFPIYFQIKGILLFVLLTLIVACIPNNNSSQLGADTISASPTATAMPEATATATTETAIDWLFVEGKTDEGFTYRGNPEAPVTVVDFSDFL